MNKIETTEVLTRFYSECEAFWLREGKDVKDAKELALKDLEHLTRNPYEPMGNELDEDAQRIVIETLRTVL